jgi:hypothetical protein
MELHLCDAVFVLIYTSAAAGAAAAAEAGLQRA